MRPSATARVNCPAAQPALENVYARTLHRACLILGGVPQLADHLKVSVVSLVAWLEGREPPPLAVFLAAVDVVLLDMDTGSRT